MSKSIDDDDEPIVLGAELAAARAIEELRKRQATEPSPLEGLAYSGPGGGVATPGFRETDTDVALRARLLAWVDLDAATYADLRSRISMEDAYTIIRFAHRATSLGLASGDPTWAEAAAAGLPAIPSDRVDQRDLMMATALTAFTLQRLGHDVVLALAKAKVCADIGAAAIFARFEQAPPTSLRDWGYQEVEGGSGVSLVQTEYEPFDPTFDIVGAAHAIAAAIEGDEHYVVDSIAVGTDLSDNWVRSNAHTEAANEALRRAVATVIVRGTRLGVDQPRRLMFAVWIVECASESDAAVVADATTEAAGEHARLAISHDRVLALTIARAVDPTAHNPESDASLERFADAFRNALTDVV